MNQKWSEKTTFQKVMDIISGIALVVWLIFEALEKTNKDPSAGMGGNVAILIVCLCEAFSFWNVRRSLSYVAIAGAVFLTTVIVLEKLWIA